MTDASETSGACSDNSTDELHTVGEILDRLKQLADTRPSVSIGNVLDAIGDRSYGPALAIPALIEITPLGAIPTVPTFLAVIIAISAAQLLMGKEHLWLPHFIQKRSTESGKLHKAADRLAPVANWLDRWFHGRLPRFVKEPFPRVAAAVVLMLCLSVPPLELLPFASSLPMLAIAAFGIALLVRDGLLMLVATAFALGAVGLGLDLVGGGGSG